MVIPAINQDANPEKTTCISFCTKVSFIFSPSVTFSSSLLWQLFPKTHIDIFCYAFWFPCVTLIWSE